MTLEVEDDAVGFDPHQLKEVKGIGIKNIESGVEYLDGDLNID